MPQTQLERMLALLTLCAAAAFTLLVVTNWTTLRGSEVAPEHVVVRSPAPQEPVEVATVTEAAVTTVAEVTKSVAPPPPRFSISAVDGPTWLEVRAGTVTGDELYFGMLEQGQQQSFRAPVWVRVGAPESVAVRLGGSAVDELPSSVNGVTEFVASRDGLKAAPAE